MDDINGRRLVWTVECMGYTDYRYKYPDGTVKTERRYKQPAWLSDEALQRAVDASTLLAIGSARKEIEPTPGVETGPEPSIVDVPTGPNPHFPLLEAPIETAGDKRLRELQMKRNATGWVEWAREEGRQEKRRAAYESSRDGDLVGDVLSVVSGWDTVEPHNFSITREAHMLCLEMTKTWAFISMEDDEDSVSLAGARVDAGRSAAVRALVRDPIVAALLPVFGLEVHDGVA